MSVAEGFILKAVPCAQRLDEVLKETHETRLLSERTPDAFVEEAQGAVAVLARSSGLGFVIDEEILAAVPSLRVLAVAGSGVDCYDVGGATRQGLPVLNNPGVGARPVVEYVMCALPLLAKGLWLHNERLRAKVPFYETGAWTGREVFGKTLGIIGLGAIGREVAVRAEAGYGMKVVWYDPKLDPEAVNQDGWIAASSLDELLRVADFLTLHSPLNEDTHHLIGEREFRLMKPGSYLVNAGRGGLVDEAALVTVLREGRLAAAAVDVFETEPVHYDNPLLGMESVIASPHLAGISVETMELLSVATRDAILAALAGVKPPHVVNASVWARRRGA